MKNAHHYILVCIIGIFAYIQQANGQVTNDFPKAVIKMGTAKISGKVNATIPVENIKSLKLTITVYNPLTGMAVHEMTLKPNDTFSFDIPLECNEAIGALSLHINDENSGIQVIGLEQNKDMDINMIISSDNKAKFETHGGLDITEDEATGFVKAVTRFNTDYTWNEYHKMTPGEYAHYELEVSLKNRVKSATDSLGLSNRIFRYLNDSHNLLYLQSRLFRYKEMAERSFKSANPKDTITKYVAKEPDKSFYTFLKSFNLNDPRYMYCYTYSDFMKAFLNIKAFHIPEIRDTPVKEWINNVRSNLQNIIGVNSTLFYEMLAANSYILQLDYKYEELSNAQIKNIKSFFSTNNKSIRDILLKRNYELIEKLARGKNLKINETPMVADSNLMDAIVSKYKGKAILVDFWATWCSPCQDAIRSMEVLKKEFTGKDLVFVYITGDTSPEETWRYQIKVIGGEQYYLSKEKWSFVTKSLDFNTIPSYLIYKKDGSLAEKIIGFPGTDKIREALGKALY